MRWHQSGGFSIMQTFQPNYFRHEKGEEEGTFHVEFHPGCHRNHWQHANSDFSPLSTHPEMMQDLFGMMQDFMTEHKEDARIIAWDLWNETWAEEPPCWSRSLPMPARSAVRSLSRLLAGV